MKLNTIKEIEYLLEREYRNASKEYKEHSKSLREKYNVRTKFELENEASNDDLEKLNDLESLKDDAYRILEDFRNHDWH